MIKKNTYTYYSTSEIPYLLFDNEEDAKKLETDLLAVTNDKNAKEKFDKWMDDLGYASWSAIYRAFYWGEVDFEECDKMFDTLLSDVEKYVRWSCCGEDITEKPFYVLWTYLMNKFHKKLLDELY